MSKEVGALVRRPQFSWTRIRGESDVEGGGGHGWSEEGEESGVGADGGSPEGERSRRRRRGGWGGGLGARAAVEREPETGRGSAAAARRIAGDGLARSRFGGLSPGGVEGPCAGRYRAVSEGAGGEPLAAEPDAAKRHIGELSMENELLPKPNRLHRICGQTRTPNRVGAPGQDATPGFLGTRGRRPHARRRRSVVHAAGSTSPAVGLLGKFLPAIKQWRNPTRLPRRWVRQKIAGCNGG